MLHKPPTERDKAKARVAATLATGEVTVYPPSTRGAASRSLSMGRRNKGAKAAKRQCVGGNVPTVASTRWGWV